MRSTIPRDAYHAPQFIAVDCMIRNRCRAPLVLALATLLGGFLPPLSQADEPEGATPPPVAAPDPLAAERARIVDYLRRNLGEPYKLGAEKAPQGFDCSGLVQQAYAAAGVEVPRTAEQQLEAGMPVGLADLAVGDLLFFRMPFGRESHLHVIVYVGDGHAIHASVTHDAVREIDLDDGPWRSRFIAARRLLAPDSLRLDQSVTWKYSRPIS